MTTQGSSVYPDIEDVALGYLLMNGIDNPDIVQDLGEGLFSSPDRREMYKAMVKSYDKHGCISGVLVSEFLRGELHTMLYSIVASVPDKISWETICDSLQAKKSKAAVFLHVQKLSDAVERGEDIQGALRNFQEGTKGVRPPEQEKSLEDLLDGAAISITESEDAPELNSGIPLLDAELGGLKRGTVYVLGAATSHGKTATALNIVENNLREGKRALIASCENTRQLPLRLAALASGYPLDWFVNPWRYVESRQKKAVEAVKSLNKFIGSLWIIDNAPITEIADEVKRHKPDIVIIDYLQRYAHRANLSDKGRLSHEIGRLVSQFGDIALEEDVSMFLLSQLSRRGRDDAGRPPELHDFKESGDIENYADVALLAQWPYRDDADISKDRYLIRCRKNKLGPLFDIELKINTDTLRIE